MALFVLSICHFDIAVCIGAFVIGLSHTLPFVFLSVLTHTCTNNVFISAHAIVYNMKIHFPIFVEVKVLQQRNILNVNHMLTLVGCSNGTVINTSTVKDSYRWFTDLRARMHL